MILLAPNLHFFIWIWIDLKLSTILMVTKLVIRYFIA